MKFIDFLNESSPTSKLKEKAKYQKFVDMVGNLKIVEKEFGHLCHDFDIESED